MRSHLELAPESLRFPRAHVQSKTAEMRPGRRARLLLLLQHRGGYKDTHTRVLAGSLKFSVSATKSQRERVLLKFGLAQ